MSINII